MISHHQAPAGQPGLGVGHRRHDGRGSPCPRRPWRPTTCRPDRVRPRRHQPHRRSDRRDGHRRARRDRLRHRCLSTRPASARTPTSPARSYFGVVVNGVPRQRDRQQGPPHRRRPVQRHAARPCHPLYQRRERHDQRQQGLRLPEERDRGQRPDRRWQRSLQRQDLRDGQEQRRHRRGSHRLHRPERHRDQERRERHREEEHRQRLRLHAGRPPRPRACCSTRPAASTSRTTSSPATR